MATAIKGKFPVTFRFAYELRYRFGFTYLDRCGRTINLIMRDYPEWVLAGGAQPNPQFSPFVSTNNGCRFTFGYQRLDLQLAKTTGDPSLTESDLGTFSEQCEALTSIVVDQLSLDDFSRIGCRVWYLFPFEKKQEAQEWVRSLGCFYISEPIQKARRAIEENPPYAAMIDLDFSHDDPEVIKPGGFIRSSFETALDKLRSGVS